MGRGRDSSVMLSTEMASSCWAVHDVHDHGEHCGVTTIMRNHQTGTGDPCRLANAPA